MAQFVVTLRDSSVERVTGADAYLQEGQMTTFFANDSRKAAVDSWSTRLFSVRTSEILKIRRADDFVAADTANRTGCSRAVPQPFHTTA